MRPGNPLLRRPPNLNETDSIENLSLPTVPGSPLHPLRRASSLVFPNGTNTSSRDYKLFVGRSTSAEETVKPNAKPILPTRNIEAFDAKISIIARQICYRNKDKTIYLPKLRFDEKQFIKLVEEDRVGEVEKFVTNHPDLNINCTNYQGITALHLALRNNSENMVKTLLRLPCIDLGDAVLSVLKNKNVNKKILLLLLDAQKRISPGLEYAGVTHSSCFPDYATALSAAAAAGDYDAVALLLARGHRLAPPHAGRCRCNDCGSPGKEDTLYHSNAKLAAYRAIASPAFIVHAACDPINTAFLLSAELGDCARQNYHLAADYLGLRRQVRAFAVDLIDCCRTSDEMEVILKQNCETWTRGGAVLPRLTMAVDYRQKEFVAHRNTQEVLQYHWMGDLQCWNNKSLPSKAFTIVSRILTTPLMLLLILIYPCHRLVQKWEIPLNKLITHVSAYFVFLGIVFYISNQDRRKQRRGPPNTGAEGPLILYVIGYVWSAARQCARLGPRRYLRDLWRWLELVMLLLFLVTFYLWLRAAMAVADDDSDVERKYWSPHDPTLLAEGTFCIATIIAYFRLMHLCQLNHQLGPLQVSLGKMIVDIYEYVIIFAIIISAFSAGLARLYQYYDGMVYEDQFGMKTVQVSSFTGILDTLNTLFWALFCMAPLESADVVMSPAPAGAGGGRARCVHHSYTERVGYFCFGCFEVISVIIVLNMLIATMSNTFQKVTGNAAIEWTFAKTQVYMHYMSQSTLPPPYNLVPTPYSLIAAIRWLCLKESAIPDLEANVDKEFPLVMSVLIQRYFRRKWEGEQRELAELTRHVTVVRRIVEMNEPKD